MHITISITLHITVSKDIDNAMHCLYLLLICISFKVPCIKYNFIFSKTTFINKYICIETSATTKLTATCQWLVINQGSRMVIIILPEGHARNNLLEIYINKASNSTTYLLRQNVQFDNQMAVVLLNHEHKQKIYKNYKSRAINCYFQSDGIKEILVI